MKKVDFIIVGQGLAGTTLAHSIEKKSGSFVIIDNCTKTTSSFAAAGIFHPFSFKRLLLSWKASIFLPTAISFYNSIENKLGEKLFSNHSLYRVFSSIEEQNNWSLKQTISPYSNFMGENISKDDLFNKIIRPFGVGKVEHAGRLDVTKYVNESRNYFKNKGAFLNSAFNYENVIQKNNSIIYKNWLASSIIFCEGPKYTQNPFFNYLPHNPCKGEIIIIESAELPNKLINKGCFIYPLGNKRFIVGSTYNHRELNYNCSESGKNELLKKLSSLGDFKYKIIDQKAGVRPTTKDRRPLIGEHPCLNNMYIFNGLGSKGVMMAPFLSIQLINSILNDAEIDPEANISRYADDYLKLTNQL